MGVLSIKGMAFSGGTVKKDVPKGYGYIKASAARNDPEALEYLIQNGSSANLKYYRIIDVERYKKQLRQYKRKEEKANAVHFLHDGC